MRRRADWISAVGLTVGIVFWAGPAASRPQFLELVPTPFQCGTCHDDPDNRQFRNSFGIDFATQHTVWATDNDPTDGVCPLDSDRDGLTNGQELGDPNCLWRRGDPLPDFDATHPGEARDPDRCGDDVIDTGEDCDGQALGDQRCEDHGFLDGALGCTPNCEYDDSVCDEIPQPDAGDVDDTSSDMPDSADLDADIDDSGEVPDSDTQSADSDPPPDADSPGPGGDTSPADGTRAASGCTSVPGGGTQLTLLALIAFAVLTRGVRGTQRH
jgi:hypothetical protein